MKKKIEPVRLEPSSVFLSTKNRKEPMFDELAQQIYEGAIDFAKDRKRNTFTLDGWKRGTGGLDDADRLTL